MEAHEKALLHRAFSVFIYNDKREILLQKRALSKYHSGGLWTNACCSHPRLGEEIIEAGKRRLLEEMGFTCELKEVFVFTYEAKLDNELTEHEVDHVLIGKYNSDILLNEEEAMEYKWVTYTKLLDSMETNSDIYTEWFKIIMENFIKNDLYKTLV